MLRFRHGCRRFSRGFNFTEVVIAVFLLAFVGLSVMSMTQTGFLAQRRNMKLSQASLIAQSLIGEMRVWAADIDNYQSDWAPYNRTFEVSQDGSFTVTARANADALPLDSPSKELESQWSDTPRGARTLPKAVVPVELVISWSEREKDRLRIVTYVAEPQRNLSGATFDIVGPNPVTLNMNDVAAYAISGEDSSGRPLPNLMFDWRADKRYLTPTTDSARDGRTFRMARDKVVNPPTSPPPPPPALSPVQCYCKYAGQNVFDGNVTPNGVELPP